MPATVQPFARDTPFLMVTAARIAWTLIFRGIFYLGLFITVVMVQVGLTTGLRAAGVQAGLALLISGVAVLGAVTAALWLFNAARELRQGWLSRQAVKVGLPPGPCCVIWRGDRAIDMPWDFARPIRAIYPPIARRLGVEGYALVEFEVGADGRARSVHCVDVWPSPLFYDAARDALSTAAFEPADGALPRFGASYRLPFVFRIRGAARVSDAALAARQARPGLERAVRAFTKS